uniref:Cysteine-rich protein n=1 Tax=Lilium longiflorum TaxID=4690 RepID=B2BA87_LILLO|nr:cysteine-rich protein [Lilium longiflorum]AIY32608.1 cysteine-rich protein [Lilium longiflorum]AKN79601.1 cysteine-rich protein [Lilium longiflorum]
MKTVAGSSRRLHNVLLLSIMMLFAMHSSRAEEDGFSNFLLCLGICGTEVASCSLDCSTGIGSKVPLCILLCTQENLKCMSKCAQPAAGQSFGCSAAPAPSPY